jgi:hypothetical protein
VVGVQRVADGARVRVVATERALVQAMRAGGGDGSQRAQAAPLPDRWANFVRADRAVAAAGSGGAGETAAEAAAALAACRSAAAEILAVWAALAEEDSSSEAGAELQRLVEFVLRGCALGAASAADADLSPDNAGALAGALDSAALVRLSYAPFAAERAAAAAGVPREALVAARRAALQRADVGVRLEEAAAFARALAARFAARRSLS